MSSSLLNAVRSGVSLCVALAVFHGQTIWCMGTERLVPGEPLGGSSQQSSQVQPGEVQKPQQAPPGDNQTTVVQVPVPKDVGLDLTVVEGEGGTNIIGKKSSAKPLVEVRDEKNELLEGAVVTFMAPADGPSVVFNNGLRTVTVMTDADGRARAPGWRAVNSGPFNLQVSATFRGQMVSTVISETNFDSAADARGEELPPGTPSRKRGPATNKGTGGGLSHTTLAIIIGAGAAAAVGIGVGLGGHKGSSSSTSSTSATIGGPGTATVGAP